MLMCPKLLVDVTFLVNLSPTSSGAKPITPESNPHTIASIKPRPRNHARSVKTPKTCAKTFPSKAICNDSGESMDT